MNHSGYSKFFRLKFFLYLVLFLFSCSPSKQASPSNKTKLPSDVAISPSSFRCEGKFISVADSGKQLLLISKMLEYGSSLFYSVSIGDTIETRFMSSKEKAPEINSPVEAVIEERLKLNSDKPDFVIRQCKIVR